MTSQYETNLWSTHVNIVRLAEPIRRCVRWRTQVFKIEGFVCKRFLPSPPLPPLLFFGSRVSFLARSKPKIPFHGLFLLRNQTETLATQATWHVKFKEPAKDCSWRLEADTFAEKAQTWSFNCDNLSTGKRAVIDVESSSIPRNVTRWVGETTLRQLTLNPREWSKRMRVTSSIWHSAWVLPRPSDDEKITKVIDHAMKTAASHHANNSVE